MGAREPDRHGFVLCDGGRSYWELFGAGDRTVFFLPTWSIVQSRFWKLQVAYLARHCRVLTMDARGSGASDRPTDPEAYGDRALAANALAAMAARAVPAGWLHLPPAPGGGGQSRADSGDGELHRSAPGVRGLAEVQRQLL